MIKIGIDGKIEKCIFDAMRFDFMKYRRNYGLYYYDFDWDTRYNESNLQKVYYDELVDFAKSVGVSEEEIESLISMGLDCFDIEELLYEPQMLNYYLYGIDEDDDLI